jgi:hypothetical protein
MEQQHVAKKALQQATLDPEVSGKFCKAVEY